MSASNQLIRRLKRELTANPKKAAILGALLVVALVFWAPLISKWLGKSEDAGSSEATTVAATPVTTTVPAPNENATDGAANKTTVPHWDQVMKWIHNDPRMRPHIPDAGARDPFNSTASRVAAQKERSTVDEPPPERTPQQAGIVLHSTIVGPRMKTALINGRAYHEKESVASSDGRQRFVLVEIHAHGVVMTSNGKSYEVKLPTVAFADGRN